MDIGQDKFEERSQVVGSQDVRSQVRSEESQTQEGSREAYEEIVRETVREREVLSKIERVNDRVKALR